MERAVGDESPTHPSHRRVEFPRKYQSIYIHDDLKAALAILATKGLSSFVEESCYFNYLQFPGLRYPQGLGRDHKSETGETCLHAVLPVQLCTSPISLILLCS